MAKQENNHETDILIRDENDLQEPPRYKVILHNDDYTSMDFVVMVLERVFNKTREDATKVMLNVHLEGRGSAGVYTREVGETKVAIVHQMARKSQYPLKCTMERID
jgi:ATP-dependent Clp protease adaptor protein ClpS